MNSDNAYKMAQGYISHTCPQVDRILSDAGDAIKDKITEPFRVALEEACQRIIDLEAELKEARDEIEDLKKELSDANS